MSTGRRVVRGALLFLSFLFACGAVLESSSRESGAVEKAVLVALAAGCLVVGATWDGK